MPVTHLVLSSLASRPSVTQQLQKETAVQNQISGMIEKFLGQLPKQRSMLASHLKADLLLVNCIDCRYPSVIHNYMHVVYDKIVYDHLVLAGASLASTEQHTHNVNWAKTFEEHVALSIELHEIDGVLILDHRTCGAYIKTGLLSEAEHNTQREFDQHQFVAKTSAPLIEKIFQNYGRKGHIAYYLTPEIPLGACSFPSQPELLHEISV